MVEMRSSRKRVETKKEKRFGTTYSTTQDVREEITEKFRALSKLSKDLMDSRRPMIDMCTCGWMERVSIEATFPARAQIHANDCPLGSKKK